MADNATITILKRGTSDFYPFVEGKPAPALADCSHCSHSREDTDCAKSEDVGPLLYAFCGPICGHFSPPGWDVIRPTETPETDDAS